MYSVSVEEARTLARAGSGVRMPPLFITPQEAKMLLDALEKEKANGAESATVQRLYEKVRILHAFTETKAAFHGGRETLMRLE